MFAATYLGHQGWLVSGGQARILVDPLLTDEYSPGFSAQIYPPRRFTLSRFPAVDAVVLSHEHADHLSVPSLALLSRAVPVVLPARSARALADAIAGLGFRVVPSRPGDRFTIGDLEVSFLGGSSPLAQLDWEVTNLQILIADRRGHGSFFTYVDGWPTAEALAPVRRSVGTPAIVCHANNAMDWSCLEAGRRPPPPTAERFAAELLAAEPRWWGEDRPAVSAICGPGLAFTGDDRWMNQILCVDSERVRDVMRAAAPGRVIRAPAAGETIELARGTLRRIAPRAPFVRALGRAAWPPLRVARRRGWLTRFSPACGERSLDDAAWSDVLAGLDRLAAFLYRRELFHGVLALDHVALGKRRPAFALVLRCDRDDTAHVLEYQPEAQRFAHIDAPRPLDTHALGLECWASDLWRVLIGRMLPQRLLGHLRTWSFSPTPLSPLFAVWGFFDALHRPAAATAFYAPLVARLRDQPPVIAAGRHARKLRRARRRGQAARSGHQPR
ncbi:MAG TPA: MBL fold metallo-hydrolase [Kofleriaceae bacterium]|nr:MBL fold metallo-hydrolase [Kofleriaceae bacterium]